MSSRNYNCIAVILEFIVMSTKWILWKRRCLLKYDEKWTGESDTTRWVIGYLLKRIELLSQVKITTKIKNELDKFSEAIKALYSKYAYCKYV